VEDGGGLREVVLVEAFEAFNVERLTPSFHTVAAWDTYSNGVHSPDGVVLYGCRLKHIDLRSLITTGGDAGTPKSERPFLHRFTVDFTSNKATEMRMLPNSLPTDFPVINARSITHKPDYLYLAVQAEQVSKFSGMLRS
jgi:carotenoid cleavage dioxygenase-like enzyme